MGKLVSIISPCYNGESYLHCFLESVLSQSYNDIELIVVDDGSTDNTLKILEKYREKFIKRGFKYDIVHNSVNQGQAAAINIALKMFSGDYLSWFDSDDIMLPNCIENKVRALEESGCDFVLCKGIAVSIKDLSKPVRFLFRKKRRNDHLFKDYIDNHNVSFVPGTIMVTRSAIKNAIPDLTIYEGRQGQNLQLMLPIAYMCNWCYLDEYLFKYVLRFDSHSHTPRTYDEEIKRCDDFNDLVNATLNKLPNVDQGNLFFWSRYANIKFLRDKLQIARIHQPKDTNIYINKLKEQNAYTLKDSAIGNYVYGFISLIIYKFNQYIEFVEFNKRSS